ncbi:MAG: hypothetical protein KAW45_05065 [Thermoplasmatales archaeon]|nr:hypothetical protein [Thermoplasmatales archaeon]
MKNKICIIGITCMLLLTSFVALPVTSSDLEIFSKNHVKDDTEENWYYLPSYPNYAPCGLPDFSEKQQEDWKKASGMWGMCHVVSLADIFWWFDSKHADQNGSPGDGNDTYPLVQDYNAPEPPNPGSYSDDHNFNNVNDNSTPWNRFRKNGEFIEQLAWYVGRIEFSPFWEIFDPLFLLDDLFEIIHICWGARRWLRNCGLQNQFTIKCIPRPCFCLVNKYVRNNCGVMIGVNALNSEKPFSFRWGHWVAVAGINSNGQIALSDPIRDEMNPSLDPAEHNNASNVSHDIWAVNFNSPRPLLSSWWLPEYIADGAIIVFAIVISERE